MVTRGTKPAIRHPRRRSASSVKGRRPAKAPAIPKRRKGEDVYEYLLRLGDSIPESERKNLPADGAANHDHYIYGAPKRY
jgi:hypothetical protein